MSTVLHKFTYYRSFTYKYWTILHLLVIFFIRFEEKQINKKKQMKQIRQQHYLFSILVPTLIVLLVSCVHVKTSTLTATGL